MFHLGSTLMVGLIPYFCKSRRVGEEGSQRVINMEEG